MEPWLDSLSEDWKSEGHSSSPSNRSSLSRSRYDSAAASRSQSRIPHLSPSIRRESVNGSYLKPRSSQGQARTKSSPILAERSPSNLNIPTRLSRPDSQKKTRTSTVPRRTSSVFSGSQQSVQHHTVHNKPDDENGVPEWKKRLVLGEDVVEDGLDLFSGSKLEGMFKKPGSTAANSVNMDANSVATNPWKSMNLAESSSPFERQQSMRASRSRVPDLEVLQEENEDEYADEEEAEAGSSVLRNGSLRGLVKNRVKSFERKHDLKPKVDLLPAEIEDEDPSLASQNDPRWRTVSGQEEIQNEDISLVTWSKQNTIRDRALKDSLATSSRASHTSLYHQSEPGISRPSSSSSDKAVDYGRPRMESNARSREESFVDFTSHSLPEDLSMGTQDFVSHGGFVNRRRGGRSNDSSFQKRPLSSPVTPSHLLSQLGGLPSDIRSSPPPRVNYNDFAKDESHVSASAPITPHRAEPTSSDNPRSSGSPLKLFGDRDTYTNTKLLRVLSHFEETEADRDLEVGEHSESEANLAQGSVLRMSHFGKGDLDGFDFEQNVQRQRLTNFPIPDSVDRIFVSSQQPDEAQYRRQRSFAMDDSNQASDRELPKDGKREHTSSLKDRTPKRRRTSLGEELMAGAPDQFFQAGPAAKLTATAMLAGTKRKDARSDTSETRADPDVLASRSMILPKAAKRQSSGSVERAQKAKNVNQPNSSTEALTEALAAELATFTNGVTQQANDSRKPSVTTKDYMEEANKVMQFIRAKGKPGSGLTHVEEFDSTLEPDAILDLDVDDGSTRDSFSRPPSREYPRQAQLHKRHAEHDPRTASYLRKYQDEDELELLANTSALCSLQLVDHHAAQQAVSVPLPEDDLVSDPSNIRIRNHQENQQIEGPHNSHSSSNGSTRRTYPTASSGSSLPKGLINSGTVNIPDKVGTMTFDHVKQTWVRAQRSPEGERVKARAERQTTSEEEDPFQNIPDLSTECTEDNAANADRQAGVQSHPSNTEVVNDMARPEGHPKESAQQRPDVQDTTVPGHGSLRSELSEHEMRIHDGQVSQTPTASENARRQPRVVTIAFSSPLVSAVAYQEQHGYSEDDNDTVDLPLDDSEMYAGSPVSGVVPEIPSTKSQILRRSSLAKTTAPSDKYPSVGLSRRPVSRIDERDEDDANGEMSLIHVSHTGAVTPATRQMHSDSLVPRTNTKGTSMICLTPLSDFSLHQNDTRHHPEYSYVEERAHPTSLRQAHGSHALAMDDLVKAITDAEPSELFWEKVRRLSLAGKGLVTVHGLQEYCSTVEELSLQDNRLSQLSGLPNSIRTLDVQRNCLTDLTCWAHMQNLQYLNVSGNQLDSLEGFESLVHLRELNASNNQIRNVDTIFGLNGLLRLSLSCNQMATVDFQGTELSRLTHLDLSHNQLSSASNLGSLLALEELNLDGNNLRGSPFSQGTSLAKLRILHMSHNEVEVLDLGRMPLLRELHMDRNRVKSIKGLSNSRHLETMSVREQIDSPEIVNFIMSTPNECCALLLSSNVVPKGVLQTPRVPHYNLRHLEIASCGISGLPAGFGDYIPNCRVLNLNFNAIKEVSPLQGMFKLSKVLLARNRITRLRRTCLSLSRLTRLASIDLRENPLTVGFYAPTAPSDVVVDSDELEPYVLPPGSKTTDQKWTLLCDEVTSLRRRTIELLIAEKCKQLVELDGLPFDRKQALVADNISKSLMALGVLQKSPVKRQQLTEMRSELPDNGERDYEGLPLNAEDGTVAGRAVRTG